MKIAILLLTAILTTAPAFAEVGEDGPGHEKAGDERTDKKTEAGLTRDAQVQVNEDQEADQAEPGAPLKKSKYNKAYRNHRGDKEVLTDEENVAESNRNTGIVTGETKIKDKNSQPKGDGKARSEKGE